MKIEYREATPSDAEAMITFLSIVGSETDNLSFAGKTFNVSEEKEAKFIERFKKSKNDLMIVATQDDKIVGNAVVSRNKISRYSHRAEISIAVLRDFWGRGIGSRLMEMMIEFAREVGIEILYLEAREDNERAVNLYKKYGFSQIGVYNNFFKIEGKYYNAVLMNKEIEKD